MKKPARLIIGNTLLLALIFVALFFGMHLRENYAAKNDKSPSKLVVVQSITELDNTQIEPAPVITQPAEEFDYIEIINGCGAYWSGVCTAVHSEASLESPIITYIRNGVTLKVREKITNDKGEIWYKIIFDEWLRYPARVSSDWYIPEKFVREFKNVGWEELAKDTNLTHKHIIVDISEQKLYAFENNQIFLETIVSTGTNDTPTSDGDFKIFRKTPTRYMQGPLPESEDVYDLPGVPWSLYFTKEGAAIHGTYWHNNFGKQTSHGCVNVPLGTAEILYKWADLGTLVTVRK